MKLILTREVAGLGHAGDVVTVKDGYARNFLLPRGSAIAWSKGGETQIAGIRRARQARDIRDKDHANEIKTTLEAADLVVKAKVGSTGRLFGSVTEKDIALVIKSATGLDIDRHKIKLVKHVKNLGKHSAKVSLMTGVAANITINVTE
ncbi:MAG: 50S ribosomal protein L9 [Actinobacteria bacterium]|jgi:large subunit ribosomal protein L9|nr:50S ribosomal protein L9 [Actinomycetota bacterium]